MFRRLYQMTLVALQVALMVQIVPPLAQALRHGVAFGAFPHGPLAVIQVASAALAITGGALALAFPGLALIRHVRRGPPRFGGLPRWSVALALAGAAVFMAGAALSGALPWLAPENRMTAVLTARPVQNAGLALMAAGVLWAEVMRRSVGVPRMAIVPRHSATQRIEVTHPPELATRIG
jgi:hypothetical protein